MLGHRAGRDTIAILRSHADVGTTTAGVEGLVVWHFLMFCYAWIDRVAFHTMGAARRNALMDLVRPHFMATLIEVSDPSLSDSMSFREELEKTLDNCLIRWESLPLPSSEAGRPAATLFWEFAKEVADIARRPLDMEAMMSVMLATRGCIDGLDAKEVVSSIVWDR